MDLGRQVDRGCAVIDVAAEIDALQHAFLPGRRIQTRLQQGLNLLIHVNADLAVQRVHVIEVTEHRTQAHVCALCHQFCGGCEVALKNERSQRVDDLLARDDAAVDTAV